MKNAYAKLQQEHCSIKRRHVDEKRICQTTARTL